MLVKLLGLDLVLSCLICGSTDDISVVFLDVVRCFLWLFTLYINMKIGKNSC